MVRSRMEVGNHATVWEVVESLIRRSAKLDEFGEPDLLTNMRLQKLLYYVQGYGLALLGEPIFNERIEAWRQGSVVPVVYHRMSKFGANVIPADEVVCQQTPKPIVESLIDTVWTELSKFSARELSHMTHQEEPWMEARKGLQDEEGSSQEITSQQMESYFLRYFQNKFPGIDFRAFWQGEREYLSGAPLHSSEDTFQELINR
jgi:uncharacterized phage-associated protein